MHMNKDDFAIMQAGLEYSLLLDKWMISKASCTKTCVFIILLNHFLINRGLLDRSPSSSFCLRPFPDMTLAVGRMLNTINLQFCTSSHTVVGKNIQYEAHFS